ncbi:MAG: FAD-binding oxidoreductase [Chlamydiales bacterium]
MRIAILGAGFAGLAVTWFLTHYTEGSATIDLYDPEPIGGSNSGLSAGLFHAYIGKQAHRSWEANKGIKETHRLITEASHALQSPIVLSKGILRPAISLQQITDFKECAKKYSEVQWWDKKKCEEQVSGLLLPEEGGGLFISEGLTIDVPAYIEGLWKACALMGTQYHQQAMVQPHHLESYDRVLIALGATSKNFPLLKSLPISPVKGQILELKWPKNSIALPFSLNSQKYLIMARGGETCFVGATYERNFTSPLPDQEKAAAEIMPKITAFFPSLADAQIVGCRAGIRACTQNHLPLAGKISDKFYFFTGLGSRGLLYHSWLGKQVARAILTQDPRHFPDEIHFQLESNNKTP